MTTVVDASILVSALTDSSTEGVWAETIIASGDLIAPHLAPVEATNILRRMELRAQLTEREAERARRDLGLLAIDLVPFEPFADRVWELRRNISAYDAWYVAVAEVLRVPLATFDRRLARATGPTCAFSLPA